MVWKWFGVKTISRWETIGKPNSMDDGYDDEATLIEERIVLIRARSSDEAIKKAEKEAVENQSEYNNFYNQKVRIRYLKCCDAFELFDEDLKSGTEIFSMTKFISKKVEDSKI